MTAEQVLQESVKVDVQRQSTIASHHKEKALHFQTKSTMMKCGTWKK
jgi:hypothetical protein